MSKVAGSYKSRYKPSHPEKYKGNSSNIICRSNWERTFCKYCDLNENVISWASEELSVKYRSPIDQKVHRYFPDFLVKTSSGKKVMIEIKPAIQCKPPKPRSRKTKRYLQEQLTFIKNISKWRAAKEYCSDNGLEFKIFTEKELDIKSG